MGTQSPATNDTMRAFHQVALSGYLFVINTDCDYTLVGFIVLCVSLKCPRRSFKTGQVVYCHLIQASFEANNIVLVACNGAFIGIT